MIVPVEAPPPPAYIMAPDSHFQSRSAVLAWTPKGYKRTWYKEGVRCWYLHMETGGYTSPRPIPVML